MFSGYVFSIFMFSWIFIPSSWRNQNKSHKPNHTVQASGIGASSILVLFSASVRDFAPCHCVCHAKQTPFPMWLKGSELKCCVSCEDGCMYPLCLVGGWLCVPRVSCGGGCAYPVCLVGVAVRTPCVLWGWLTLCHFGIHAPKYMKIHQNL